ncbi:E3 ubiquitin-protein ligase ubr1 [Entomophthora muscae]|uniref:E3 ubiquitin-protein ligase ubr1 n=1 Tax=Entomophthora muscae TaxID=34485 RepID=A0ACC2S5S8_9FUNG|nr:E3 ubiquitin-protein ligase ubr1 [Entomophthora muscae]
MIGCSEFQYDPEGDMLTVCSENRKGNGLVQTGTHCGKLFEKNEPVYSCINCSMDPTCVLCAACFESTDHTGHDVRIHLHTSGYGCCDCGDSEAFKVPLNCKYHNQTFHRSYDDVSNELPDSIKSWLGPFIETVLDFAIDVFRCSSDELFDGLTEEKILKDEHELELIWGPASNRLYTLMLWNDESHSYNQVIDLCQEAIRCSDQDAIFTTTSVDRVGRQPLLTYPDIPALLSKARVFKRAKLGVTIRSLRIVGLEDLAAICLHYLALLADKTLECHYRGCFSAFYLETLSLALVRPYSKPHANPIVKVAAADDYFVTEEFVEMPVTCARFFSSRASLDRSVAVLIPPSMQQRPAKPVLEFGQKLLPATMLTGVPRARLDWIFQLDSQLWKSVRLELQALFTRTLLSLPQFKLAAAAHYAVNYPFYSKPPKHRNPEPDTGLIAYAVQLFTAPSIALVLATELDFVSYLFTTLGRELIEASPSVEEYHGTAPGPMFKCNEDLYEHRMVRCVLRDLDFFLDFPAVRHHISSDLSLFFQALHFISSFQRFSPSKRKTGDHVAYQDQRFRIAIETAFHILDIVKPLSEAFHGQPTVLLRAIYYTVCKIGGWILSDNAPWLRKVPTYFGTTLDIVQCDVASESMSFYHPLHWMLAGLLSDVASLTPQHLAASGYADLRQLLLSGIGSGGFAQRQLQMAFDFPLQTFVLSAQVRANLWVRNGMDVLTEDAYFRASPKSFLEHGFLLMQHMFILFPPDVVLATLVDRYGLGAWLFLEETSPFDVGQQVSLTEDMLLLIIHCLCERGKLLGESLEDEARCIIVRHSFRATTFSRLQEKLPPSIAQLPQLNQLLNELCTFKPPDTLADSGKYTLKPEFHRLLNPHHYLNSRNKIDNAAEFKKEAANDPHWFIPSLLPLPPHLKSLIQILHTPYMAGILFYTLHRAVTTPEARSTLIDYVLQMLVVATIDDYEGDQTLWELVSTCRFRVPFTEHDSTCTTSLISLAEAGVGDDKEGRLLFVLDAIARRGNPESCKQVADFLVRYQDSSESRAQEQERENRRALAKARRAQLMNDMNLAQASFVEQHNELYQATEQVEGELEAPEEQAVHPGQMSYLTGSCILCQEEGGPDAPYGIPCLIQNSVLLAHQQPEFMELDDLMNASASQASPDSHFVKSGFHVSSCGHLIHLKCLKLMFQADLSGDSFLQSLLRRFQFEPPRNWFSCPLCHSLNNGVIPVIANPGIAHPIAQGSVDFSEWLRCFLGERSSFIAQCNIHDSEDLPEDFVSPSYAHAATSSPPHASDQEYAHPTTMQGPEEAFNDSIEQSDLHPDVTAAYIALIDAVFKTPPSESRHLPPLEYGSPKTGLDPLLYSLCYTITMVEISDRSTLDESSIPYVFDRISTITQDTLVMLWNAILTIYASSQEMLSPLHSRRCLLRLDQLSGLTGPSPITQEPFKILVELSLAGLPVLGCEILGLVQLLFLLQFVRSTMCLIHASTGEPCTMPPADGLPHTAALVEFIFGEVACIEDYKPNRLHFIPQCQFIQHHLVVFLRKVTLLFKALQLPLLRPNPSKNELEDLLAALSLPDSESIFQSACADEVQRACISAWCRNARSDFGYFMMLEFPFPYSLATLGERMDSMYAPCDEALEEVCQSVSNNPALCLLCQKVICASPIVLLKPPERCLGRPFYAMRRRSWGIPDPQRGADPDQVWRHEDEQAGALSRHARAGRQKFPRRRQQLLASLPEPQAIPCAAESRAGPPDPPPTES